MLEGRRTRTTRRRSSVFSLDSRRTMEDLGLSLALAPAGATRRPILSHRPAPSWGDLFPSGIDVNRPPAEAEAEEEGASSPNSTVSSVSGKRGGARGEADSETERACSDDEDAAAGDGSRKKLRLSKDQAAILEESFKEHNTLNPKQKMALANQLHLRPRQVEVWFQNRRARTKLKQTEVDCEFLKRCCENLTEENRRLQKEVQELRALKLSPQFYMHMTPPTTLTMCPSCERVSAAASAAPPTSVPAASPSPSVHRNPFYQQQHTAIAMPQQRPMNIRPSPGGPVLPWAPMPLRSAAFFDAQPQLS